MTQKELLTQKEFERRTGLTSNEAFEYANKIYMGIDYMGKDMFCDDYNKHRTSFLFDYFYKKYMESQAELENLKNEREGLVDFLLVRAQEFGDEDLLNKVIGMVGHAEVIKRKLSLSLELWPIDKKYIKDNIK